MYWRGAKVEILCQTKLTLLKYYKFLTFRYVFISAYTEGVILFSKKMIVYLFDLFP
jgi:hypothetical protein